MIYKVTATKSKKSKGRVFAFGRNEALEGKPKARGGYMIFGLHENYSGTTRSGIAKSWRLHAQDLSYADAVTEMNRLCGFEAWNQS